MRLPGARPLAAPPHRPPAAGTALRTARRLFTRRELAILAPAGLATFFVSFDSAVLVLALPAISADFRTSNTGLTWLGSALQLGTLAGLPMAMLADHLGRRRVLVAAVVGFSLTNLGSAAAPGLAWLAAWRVVAVCFETVAAGVATALVIEGVAAGRRGMAVAAITVAAGAGTGLTTLLYPLLAPGWRLLYLLGGAGLAAAVVLAWTLPESAAWVAASGGRRTGIPLGVLLRPPWRARLLVAAAAATLGSLFYQPATLLVALFGSRQLGFGPTAISAVIVVSGLISVPAFLVGGRLSDRFGRRRLGVALAASTACFGAFTFAGGRAGYWTGSVGWSVLASASVPVLGAWYGELFPTRARATSESVNAVAGAFGGVLGFQLIALLQPLSWLGPALGRGLVATAGGALFGACLLLLLPETRGDPLLP